MVNPAMALHLNLARTLLAWRVPTILPALLEEELNQDIDELHFAPLNIDQQLATVAVIHQQHMRNIAQWLQENGITRATVAPDWMSIPCGFMACDAQRVICRIDECRGWSAGLALAPVMFRAQLNEQDLPLSLTVVGIAPEKVQGLLERKTEDVGLGISLVNRRIQLIYGARYGVTIESLPKPGCMVTTTLLAHPPGGEE